MFEAATEITQSGIRWKSEAETPANGLYTEILKNPERDIFRTEKELSLSGLSGNDGVPERDKFKTDASKTRKRQSVADAVQKRV